MAAAAMAAAWSLQDCRWWKVIVHLSLMTCYLIWMVQCWQKHLVHRASFEAPPLQWSTDVLAPWVCFIALAYWQAWIGVRDDRRGEIHPWPDLQTLYNRLMERFSRRVSPSFRSAEAAQFWLEWRPRGWVTPGLAAGVMAMILYGVYRNPAGKASELLFVMGVWVLPSLGALLAGVFFGDRTRGKHVYDPFVASRPLTNTQLAAAVMRAAWVSTAATWLVCMLFVAAGWGILASSELFYWADFRPLAASPWLRYETAWPLAVLFSLSISLGVCGWSASIGMTGRQSVASWTWSVFWGVICLGLAASQAPSWRAYFVGIAPALACLGGGVLWAASVGLHIFAYRRGVVGARILGIAAAVWLAGSALSGVVFTVAWFWLVLISGGWAAMAACWPAAPLATAWNRHR